MLPRLCVCVCVCGCVCVYFPQSVKASRDGGAVEGALAKLRESAAMTSSTSAGDHTHNLLALCVDAAKKRCVCVRLRCWC